MSLRSRGPGAGRRPIAALLVPLLLLAGVLGAPTTSEAGPTGSSVNAARAAAGLRPLAEHDGLDSLAGRHARAMADRGSLYHMPDLAGAVSGVVPDWTRVGQNVGAGNSLTEVETLLMQSAEHRANILGDFTLMGSGAVTDGSGRVWVSQIFAKAAPAPAPAPTTPTTQAAPPTTQPAPVPITVPQRASRSVTMASAPVVPVEPGPPTLDLSGVDVADTGIVAVASAPTRSRSYSWRRWRPPRTGPGYWLAGADGGVFAYGRAPYLQSLAGRGLNAPVVALAALRSGKGYWLASADGGVFAFGQAPYFSSLAGQPLKAPVRAFEPDPAGTGYWLASADGGVYAFGKAPYLGSLTGQDLEAPLVALEATPSGQGYWVVTASGAVYAFGDAAYAGGLTAQDLTAPVVGLEATPSGRGYRLVSADGGVYAFGDATFEGSLSGRPLNARVIALDPTSSGRGYRLVSADGGVFAFGDASFVGSVAGRALNRWLPSR